MPTDALATSQRPLNLVFYDLNDHPEDRTFWAGTTSFIVDGLRRSGHTVTSVGRIGARLRKPLTGAFWHAYKRLQKHYNAERHVVLTRAFTLLGNRSLALHTDADAIVTVSTAYSAYLATQKPVIVLLDATWGQVVETYPYFHRANLPAHIHAGGFAMDRLALGRQNLHLIMTSAWAANRAIADYGADPDRVHVLPFAANFAEDPPRTAVEQAINARDGRHCNLLFVGKEFDRKGGPIAVEVARLLLEQGVPTTLHVVGCVPPHMPAWVKVYGTLRKDQADQLSSLQRLYAESDFFLLPTRAEAQGIVFNEAAAYGLPAVGTDVGGVSAVVQRGGHLFPLEAGPEEYAEWIAAQFKDRSGYRSLAEGARDDYDQRLSRDVYTTKLVALLRTICQSSSVV